MERLNFVNWQAKCNIFLKLNFKVRDYIINMQIQTVLKMILQLVYTVKTVYLPFYDYVYILFVP